MILLWISVSVFANDRQLFDSANFNYQNGNFEKAVILYEEILAKGIGSPEVYFNLGNAYYRSNSLSGAILNYERALRLSPGDRDIEFNLEIARAHLVDKIEEIPPFFLNKWIQVLSSILTSDGWAWFSITGFSLLVLVSGFFIFSRSVFTRKLLFLAGLALLFVSISGFYLSWKQNQLMRSQNEAIIISSIVVIKSSPDDNSTDLFILHEGTKVIVREKLGAWREISLPDGKRGWLKENTFEVI